MNLVILISALLASGQFTIERVMAVVGSEPVLHSEVVTLMIESGVDQESSSLTDWDSPSYRAALQQVIQEKLLVEAARREGVYPTREEVEAAADEAIAEVMAEFPSEAQFNLFLGSMGMSPRSLRDSYESVLGDRLAGENFVRIRAGAVMSALPVDPRSYFEDNPQLVEEILAPRVLSWIYIPVLPGNTAEQYRILSGVREQIESGETTFSAAAALYSQDGSAANGGDLGWFGAGDMTATFERQVTALEPGEIAGPFTTPFGVHLAKVTDIDGDQIRASHILLMAESTQSDLDDAVSRAMNVQERMVSGEDFASIAGEISYDPATAENGGFLGTVNVGNWDGELHDGVIDLEPGQVSQPLVVEQSLAVAVFRRMEGEPDWSEFTEDEMQSMLQSVFWNSYYDSMVDSLASEIPVLMNIEDAN